MRSTFRTVIWVSTRIKDAYLNDQRAQPVLAMERRKAAVGPTPSSRDGKNIESREVEWRSFLENLRILIGRILIG